jgi:hypothetical protein
MNKSTKIIIAFITTILLLLIIYFFLPKTTTKCCDPEVCSICMTCKCSMGIPSHTIGGNLEPNCFMGKLLDCKKFDGPK